MDSRQDVILNITEDELLPEDTSIHLTDDGTVFYFSSDKNRLYVNSKVICKRLNVTFTGRHQIIAKLPDNIYNLGVHGNELYFEANDSVYKAMFSSADSDITVSYVRDRIESESFLSGALCHRIYDENLIVYRMCDDPNDIGNLVHFSNVYSIDMKFCIHRGKVIFFKGSSTTLRPSVRKFNEQVFLVEMDLNGRKPEICARESSNFIYISQLTNFVYTLDTTNIAFLENIMLSGVTEVSHINGVIDGLITMDGYVNDRKILMSAQLPEKFHANAIIMISMNRKAVQKMEQHIKELEASQPRLTMINQEIVAEKKLELPIVVSVADSNLDCILDQFCCSVCNETYDSEKIIPRFLDCGHTFCEICLYNERIRIQERVKCPICETFTPLPDGKILPKNFMAISVSEQLMKSKVDPKITCKACGLKCSSTSVRMCIKNDCSMFNHLICANCALDGDHGGHVVKYDVYIEKLRAGLREEIDDICSKVEERKSAVLEKTELLSEVFEALKANLADARIPFQVFSQLDSIGSEQEAVEYKEIVNDLANTIITQCDTMVDAFEAALTSVNSLALVGDLAMKKRESAKKM